MKDRPTACRLYSPAKLRHGPRRAFVRLMIESKPATVLIAEELTLMREGIAALCASSSRFQVVGQCGDGIAAYQLIDTLRPDIALLDLGLPRLFTLELVRKVRRAGLPAKLVLLSVREDRKTVLEALRCGIHGFLLKSAPARELTDCLNQVLCGSIYVSPRLELDKIFTSNGRKGEADPLQSLSSREHQVFSFLIDGLRAKEIASRLDLSPKTVDTYRASLMRKLEIHDVASLVKFAIQRNLTPIA